MTGDPPLTAKESDELRQLLCGRHFVLADERSELLFRREQLAWHQRIAASRRLAPLENGVVDSLAPAGRWAA